MQNIVLFTSKVLEKQSFFMILKLFDILIFLLWMNDIRYNDVLIFVCDTVSYMIKSDTTIKALYSKIIHVTYISDGMHVSENIYERF